MNPNKLDGTIDLHTSLTWDIGTMELNQVTLGATDFDDSVRFYQLLGLRLIVSARSEYARFELPDGNATLSLHTQDSVAPNGPIIHFEVDDLDGTVHNLQQLGLRFTTQPQDKPWLWREARLDDPAGNHICLFHAGPNRKFPPWRISSG